MDWIFEQYQPAIILLITTFLAAINAWSKWGRTRRHFPDHYCNCLISILISFFLITGLTIKGIFQLENWYSPQFLIPVLCMVIGNSLYGISLALDHFLDDLYHYLNLVETSLGLGSTAIRTGMIQIINSMVILGVVNLLGMMTGQILVRVSPSEAVCYHFSSNFRNDYVYRL